MKISKQEIIDAMQEMANALIECREAQDAEENAKLRVIKARKRLQMAREAVNLIKFN